MQKILIKGNVLSEKGFLRNNFLLIEGARIKSIGKRPPPVKKTTPFFDTKGLFVLPGFIDLHLHGEPKKAAKYFSKFGTTGFLSTIPSIGKNALKNRISHIKEVALDENLPSRVLGVHLEGPYINKKMAGAQKRSSIREIDITEIKELLKSGSIKIVSFAPELKNSKALVKLLVKNNVVSSLAHTEATYKQSLEAVKLGANFAAHTFNRMGTLHHRAPGVLGAVLTDARVFCEAILDGLHIDEVLFDILLRCKPLEKLILSTDSIRFEEKINIAQKGSLYMQGRGDKKIILSDLTMNSAIRNAMRFGNLSLKDATQLATINPALLLGIDGKKGSLRVGKDADIVIADTNLKVCVTICEGKIVYMA